MSKFVIIADTREKPQYRWNFSPNKYCEGTEVNTVKMGDYTIKGLEHLIFVERKHSIGEWTGNLTEKTRRFFRLLDKTNDIKYKLIVCSFSYIDILNFPLSLRVSAKVRSRIKISANYIKSVTSSIIVDYNIPILFFDFPEHAQEFTFEYLKSIWRAESNV